ncbi:FAD-binding oxidoreductase [Planobispora siamensis]|uniref:FAD-linked oxidase n=1 Tax=Planobispora siamensis TaxID=936338 RepID=A0A8J3SQQ9_9ACTN|nr:FAD-binding oxidoreductase [Planobispora siamensis]GIH96985.1 FAD-linked oxidase [Planobispora siamensis]
MTAHTPISSAALRLRGVFTGPVHLPGEPGYDERRRPLYAPIDPRPALIVEAADAGDVRAAVTVAREHGMPLAVQATGHGTHDPADGGLLLRTSRMSRVMVDPDRRLARVGPGACWGEVLAAAAPFGLAPLSGSHSSVGVTGYTLGGGVGWLARRYGFAADSVLRAQVVTADGRMVTADADGEHADLWWALRGGGGSFGVVTALEFALHPVEQVYAGTAYFPIEGAADLLTRYRQWIHDVPDELSTAVLLTTAPDAPGVPGPVRGRRVAAIKVMSTGLPGDARRLLRPLWLAAGGPLAEDLRLVGYARAEMGGTGPAHVDLFDDLPDPVIDALTGVGGPATVEVRHWGGAMAEAGPDAGPVGNRRTPLSVVVDADVPGLAAALRPHATGGSFLNFLHDTGRTATAYTPEDHRRLSRIKAAYDPENVFAVGHVIPPARLAVPAAR